MIVCGWHRGRRRVRPPLLRSASEALRALPSLPGLLVRPTVSWPVAEKMMLVVTSVNRCRYCAYVHTRTALMSGISAGEIDRLVSLEVDEGVDAGDAAALSFARHYAESGGRPSAPAMERMVATYGRRGSRQLLVVIRCIMLANALGNAFDWVIGRRPGRDRSGG